jgi:hypothetical protein
MRALAILVGLVVCVVAGYGAFTFARAVGPDDRSNEFGYGDSALAPPGGGNLLQSKNFALVVDALKRELGAEGGVDYLNVELTKASATGHKGGQQLSIQIDASGRSESNPVDSSSPSASVPVAKIDPAAVDKLVKAARKETGSPVESLTLSGNREWRAEMLRGEPDSFIANLDGGGLHISGEPNPVPQGANEDSLFRHKNLEDVLEAASKEGNRVRDLSVWPERVSITLASGSREIVLNYGYDAQLTSRDVRAQTGAGYPPVGLEAINIRAIERMAAHKEVKGLENVQYVLLSPAGQFGEKPMLSMYLPEGFDPAYVVADLQGHGLTWPGRN